MTGGPFRYSRNPIYVAHVSLLAGLGFLRGNGWWLALAPLLKARDNEATIELVFFDGEESLDFDWNNARALFGSKRFVQRHQEALERGELPPPPPPLA